MPTTPKKQGVATRQPDPDVKDDEVVVETRSPRDIALEAMGERQEESRRQSIDEGLAEDPGAAQIQHGIEDAQRRSRADAEAEGLLPPLETEDGAADVTPMHKPEKPVRKDLPKDLQKDPLAEFIVMDDGEPMFVTKVNGQNMLIPLDDARRRLQIRVAAEVDLKNAREYQKTLDARAVALDAGERAFKARMGAVPKTPTTPAYVGMTEEEIRKEARIFVGSAFSEDEDTAAEKLTKLLLKTRTPAQVSAPAPVIDEDRIVRRARAEAVQELRADEQKKDLVAGITTFEDEYPDILGDARLYSMADNMTDEIATEHPNWKKSQVMMEAGKRTREWVDNIRGTPATVEDDDDDVTTKIEVTPKRSVSPTQTRQERKQGLVRIPQAAGAGAQVQKDEPVRQQSPQEALAETRASRGQPV